MKRSYNPKRTFVHISYCSLVKAKYKFCSTIAIGYSRSASKTTCRVSYLSISLPFQRVNCSYQRLTAQAPAKLATIPLLISIGLTPLVLLKIAPLNAPATTLFVISCFPRNDPIVLLIPLYTIATTPALFPKNGPLLVTAFSTPLSRNRGAIVGGFLRRPSESPHAPPTVSAERYETPVP